MTMNWRARVLDVLDDLAEDMLDFLSHLVRIPSVGGTDIENTAQHDVFKILEALAVPTDLWQLPLQTLQAEPGFPGMEVPREEAWGLVGRLPGTGGGATLMFNSHIDVVPPGDLDTWAGRAPYSGRVDGNLLYGRGSCDMKAGFAAALFAFRALRHSRVPLQGDVLFASVQGEEDGGLGTYAMIRRGWRADACVIPEPTGLDLVPANAGSLTFRLRIHGHATHAARRTAGVSALDKLWPVCQALAALEKRRNSSVDPVVQRWDIPYPLSLGAVRCGQWASTVPDLLIAEGRIGVALQEPVDTARAELEQAVAEACATDPWLQDHPVTVEWWGGVFEPGQLPASSDLVDRIRNAHQTVTTAPQQIWAAPFGSDLRLMTNLASVPTVHYGPGDVTLAHGPNESVPLSQVLTCARALAVLAVDVCGLD